MKTERLLYQENNQDLEAFIAYPLKALKEKTPVVILCHAWKGRDDFICEKAKEIANLGWVGFSLDMYGKGVLGNSKEENISLKKPFVENREKLQKRVFKAFEKACSLPYVDREKVAVLGYGFGGMCALDLARCGAKLKRVISVYGHLDSPPRSLVQEIQAKILVLHGSCDPIVPQEELRRFEKEMEASKVDWQVHIYGGAMHAFATPGANIPAAGILYHPKAAERSFLAIQSFLHEIF